jgi:hypothetical protein
MKPNVLLAVTSLLAILLAAFHLADDIVRGFEKGGVSNLAAVPFVVLWLYATLVLVPAERPSGHVINLLFSLFVLVVPLVHMGGKGVGSGSRIANSSGAIFFVWTLIAIGVTGLFSAVLSARELWSLRGRPPGKRPL